MDEPDEIPAIVLAAKGALDGLPSAVFLVDRKGQYRYANAAAAALMQRLPEAIVGQHRHEISIPERGGERLVSEPWRAPDGRVLGAVISVRYASAERLVARADHWERTGALASAVVNEANNPLTILLDGLAALTERSEAAQQAIASGNRVAEILGDVALVTQQGTVEERAAIDLEGLLERACDSLGSRATLSVSGLPRVSGRPGALARLFARLVGYAGKRMADLGDEASKVEISASQDKESVVVTLRYRAGASEGHDPFFFDRTTPNGVDLPLAREISNEHHGTLELVREGELEVIRARLPIGLPTGVFMRNEVTPPYPSKRVAHVLIVDDEPLVARALGRLLRRGFDVMCVGPVEALDVLVKVTPDVIVTDVMMPVVSGNDLVLWIQKNRPDLLPSVVIMTGGAYTARGRQLVESGEFPVLTKPFDVSRVHRTLQATLQKVLRTRASKQA